MTTPAAPFGPARKPFTVPPRFDAAYTAWNTVASYDDYTLAQRAVDQLSDDGFPVEHLDIVGSDLRLVERVTGRLTKGRAAAAGAASGAWLGVLIGTLLGIFTAGSWLGLLLVGAVIGGGGAVRFPRACGDPRRARLRVGTDARRAPVRPRRPQRLCRCRSQRPADRRAGECRLREDAPLSRTRRLGSSLSAIRAIWVNRPTVT